MKRKYFIPIIALLLFFSCKKNNDVQSPLANKIKKTTFKDANGDVGETEYFYDAAGRLSKFISSDGRIVELTYEPGKLLSKVTNSNGVFNSVAELNSRGLRVSSQSTDGSSFSSYAINSSGYLEKEVLINFTSGLPTFTQTRAFFYNASTGLLDSIVLSSNNSKATSIYTAYTNYPDDFNKNTGASYNAPSLKFLPAETNSRSANDPPGFYRKSTYSYEFDSKNRVSKRTIVNQNTSSITQYFYYD